MKRAKQRQLKPRDPVAISPAMKKGGVHGRKDKRASRAKQKALLRGESGDK